MKRIHPEDPRVTAYALGDSPEHEAADLRHAAEANPAVQTALDQTHALAELIRAGFKSESHELGEARREAIRRAGRRPTPENLVSLNPPRKWLRPIMVSAAAAALVACAIWMMQQIPVGEDRLARDTLEAEQRAEVRMQILLGPAHRPGRAVVGSHLPPVPPSSLYQVVPEVSPEVVDEEYVALRRLLQTNPDAFFRKVREVARSAGLPSLSKLPSLADNPFIPTREEARSTVPIVSGTASYHLVDRFVRTEKKLPPKNGVRTEELINQVSYEDEGDADLNGIKLGAELVRCPWDRGAILMGVLLQNGSEKAITRDAILQVEVKPDQIRSYRLIGYGSSPAPEPKENAVSQGLAPGKSNYVIYQLLPLDHEIFQAHRVVARVALRLGAESSRGLIVPVTSPTKDWEHASNDLQTAVSLGAWGMLLRESPFAGNLSVEMLETLTKDAVRGTEEGDLVRREALQLIVDSLPLFEREE